MKRPNLPNLRHHQLANRCDSDFHRTARHDCIEPAESRRLCESTQSSGSRSSSTERRGLCPSGAHGSRPWQPGQQPGRRVGQSVRSRQSLCRWRSRRGAVADYSQQPPQGAAAPYAPQGPAAGPYGATAPAAPPAGAPYGGTAAYGAQPQPNQPGGPATVGYNAVASNPYAATGPNVVGGVSVQPNMVPQVQLPAGSPPLGLDGYSR